MGFLRNFIRRRVSAFRSRQAAEHLMELDDDRLSDIGIQRGMIEYYIRNGRDRR